MYVFIIKVVSALPIGILQAMFSIVAMDYFHLDAKSNGLVLSYVGIMAMVGSTFLSKPGSHLRIRYISYLPG